MPRPTPSSIGCPYYEKTRCPRRQLPRCQSKLLKGGIGAGLLKYEYLKIDLNTVGARTGLLNDLGHTRWRLVPLPPTLLASCWALVWVKSICFKGNAWCVTPAK